MAISSRREGEAEKSYSATVSSGGARPPDEAASFSSPVMRLLQNFGVAGRFRVDKGLPLVTALVFRQDTGGGDRVEEGLGGGSLPDRLLEDGLDVVGNAGRAIDAAP